MTTTSLEQLNIYIFINYRLRRIGLLRAFGTDVGTLYLLCDPDYYKEYLCLYGYPDGTWDVKEECMVLPPNLPEPGVGINRARDVMRAIDWVTFVAEHCDSWLLSLAFFFSVGLSHDDRESLFERINEIPTLAEKVKRVLSKTVLNPIKDPGSKSKHR